MYANFLQRCLPWATMVRILWTHEPKFFSNTWWTFGATLSIIFSATNSTNLVQYYSLCPEPPLGGRPNTKLGDHDTPNVHNRWFLLFYHAWGPAWIEIYWNRIGLKARSHMTSHYTWGSVTTLYDFGGVLGRPSDTFFWALTISWSRLLARVWRSDPYLTARCIARLDFVRRTWQSMLSWVCWLTKYNLYTTLGDAHDDSSSLSLWDLSFYCSFAVNDSNFRSKTNQQHPRLIRASCNGHVGTNHHGLQKFERFLAMFKIDV